MANKISSLSKYDVESIKEPNWLTDSVFSFYFEILKNKYTDGYLFVSPQITQLLKCLPEDAEFTLASLEPGEKNYMFFVVNNNNEIEKAGGSHWSLLVYSRPENKFCHYDSCKGTNLEHSLILKDILMQALMVPNAQYIEEECLQQVNGYDCGIHVLCTVDLLCHMAEECGQIEGKCGVSIEVIKQKRNHLMNIICEDQIIQTKDGKKISVSPLRQKVQICLGANISFSFGSLLKRSIYLKIE